jgi:quercetin dioxygenase-like cupin family protein
MRHHVIAAITLGLLLAAYAFAQTPPSETRRFDPPVELRASHAVDGQAIVRGKDGGLKPVTLGIRSWIIPNRQQIQKFPEQGLLVIHVRAGSLTTIIDSKRQVRGPDDSWTVPAGTAMGIETGDDSVILQVITLREPGQAERR